MAAFCCTIRDDLLTEVVRVLGSEPRPEYIVIETSAVSKPVAVAETFLNLPPTASNTSCLAPESGTQSRALSVVDAAARTGVEYEAVAVPHERTMEQFSVC
jgi:G3E family GTPase